MMKRRFKKEERKKYDVVQEQKDLVEKICKGKKYAAKTRGESM